MQFAALREKEKRGRKEVGEVNRETKRKMLLFTIISILSHGLGLGFEEVRNCEKREQKWGRKIEREIRGGHFRWTKGEGRNLDSFFSSRRIFPLNPGSTSRYC